MFTESIAKSGHLFKSTHFCFHWGSKAADPCLVEPARPTMYQDFKHMCSSDCSLTLAKFQIAEIGRF